MQIFITAAGWNEELPLQNFHISGIKAKVNKAGSIIFTEDFYLEDVRLQVEDGSRVEEKTIRTHKSISAMKTTWNYSRRLLPFFLCMLLSVFGNNAQTLPFRLSKGAGTFRLGVVCGNESCWLTNAVSRKRDRLIPLKINYGKKVK